jgi:G:T-mismatch repair DNA endonuclease (very short patch repair protein)/endogenous inhibitor of DNA gyrase (YacG/DUF329 family)
MSEKHEKICLHCNKNFLSNRNNAKYCSNDCRFNSMSTTLNPLRKRKIIKCEECNKEVEVQNYVKTRFCSISCSSKNQQKKSNIVLNKQKLSCEHCGKDYIVWNYRKNSKFCSNVCKHLSGRIKKNCNLCGKEYVSSNWEDGGYCSNGCKSKFVGKRTSKFEKEIFEFLKLNIKNLTVDSNGFIDLKIRKTFPDILINNKILIECYGDYWHCNPLFFNFDYYHKQIRKTAKEIWENDNERVKLLSDNGYEVIIIWENDYKTKKITLDKIKNKINEIHQNKKN